MTRLGRNYWLLSAALAYTCLGAARSGGGGLPWLALLVLPLGLAEVFRRTEHMPGDDRMALEARAPGTRQPVLGAQLVEQGAAHAQLAVGLEGHAAAAIKTLDGGDQADVGGGVEVAGVDRTRQARGEAAHALGDETLVDLDQRVALGGAASARELAPEAIGRVELARGLPARSRPNVHFG